MKQLAYPVLLATLLAGCSGAPSKEAAIEDRAIQTGQQAAAPVVEATRAEVPKVEAAPVPPPQVETRAAADAVPVSETAGKTEDGVKTSGAATQPVSEKEAETVRTQPLVAPGSEVKSILADKAPVPAEAAVPVAPTEPAAAQDASTLPPPDAVPTAADLKNPEHLLSQRRLLFDYDSAAIRDEYRPVLEAHVMFLKSNHDAKVILQGHADERGSREYNLALGQRRAESVYKVMSVLGVPEAQMEAVSLGEEKPLKEGHDESSWQENRRTELLYQGE